MGNGVRSYFKIRCVSESYAVSINHQNNPWEINLHGSWNNQKYEEIGNTILIILTTFLRIVFLVPLNSNSFEKSNQQNQYYRKKEKGKNTTNIGWTQ